MFERIKQWWRKRQRGKAVEMLAGYIARGDMPMIHDGAETALPVLLPGWLKRDLRQSGKLDEFLQESYRVAARFQFDSPYKNDNPVSLPVDDPLREWNWQTREMVLSATHAAFQRNPIAFRGAKYTAAFVVGDGFKLNAKNREVEAVLMEFIDDPENRIREMERQAPVGLVVDGEVIVRVFAGKDDARGQTAVVPMRPWELRSIKTEMGNFRRVEEYRFQLYETEGDEPMGGTESREAKIPADEIIFVAINNMSYELRGRPEMFPILAWLRAYKEWLENRARINYWRSVLMWLVSVDAPASAVASVAARYAKPPTPGTVAVESAKVDVKPLNATVGAADVAEDGRQIKLMSAVGMGLPEYMLSDGENANLATSNKQELPALTTFADMQRTLVEELWMPLFRKVVQHAVDAGRLPEMVTVEDQDGDAIEDEGSIEAVEAFDVVYEPLQQSDIKNIADALDIATRNEWVSKETASGEMGFDYRAEKKKMSAEREEARNEIAQGLRMMPPGIVRPEGMDGEPEDNPTPNPSPQAERGETLARNGAGIEN